MNKSPKTFENRTVKFKTKVNNFISFYLSTFFLHPLSYFLFFANACMLGNKLFQNSTCSALRRCLTSAPCDLISIYLSPDGLYLGQVSPRSVVRFIGTFGSLENTNFKNF